MKINEQIIFSTTPGGFVSIFAKVTDFNALVSDVGDLKQKISSLEGKVNALENRVASLEMSASGPTII